MPENIRAVWSEEELDQALAALHPPSDPDEQELGRARTELLVSGGGAPVPAPVRRRRWSWWAAAGTVAAVAASLLVVQVVRQDDGLDTAAGEQLNIAADRINAVDEPLGPAQYRYIATHAWWMTSSPKYNYLEENLIETWVPADEKQDWLSRKRVTGARQWITGTEEEARADGLVFQQLGSAAEELQGPCGDWGAKDDGREPCTTEGSWQSPNAEFLASLPRDTDELYDRLRTDTADRGKDPSLQMVVYVADLLRTGLAPADLRAALYRVLAKVPGLQITEQVANLDGRKGTAFGISAAGERHDVIIDPATGQFIGERQITEKGWQGVPPGTVTGYTSVTTAVVSGMGVAPEVNEPPSTSAPANEPTPPGGSAIDPTSTSGSANESSSAGGSANESSSGDGSAIESSQPRTPPPAHPSQTETGPPVVTSGP